MLMNICLHTSMLMNICPSTQMFIVNKTLGGYSAHTHCVYSLCAAQPVGFSEAK